MPPASATAPPPADAATSPIPAVALSAVARIFGTVAPLRSVSATLPAGSITLLLGENGAGKSTLLRLIAGLATPSRGTVRVFAQDPRRSPETRSRIAYVSHSSMLYDELSADENLRYFGKLHRSSQITCDCAASPEMALRAVGLAPRLTRPVAQFSQGMRPRAPLPCALQTDPDLLLLDEPFSNLDTAGVRQMLDLLADFRTWPSRHDPALRRTILLTTHQASLALPLADRVLRLHEGTLHDETA